MCLEMGVVFVLLSWWMMGRLTISLEYEMGSGGVSLH